jgi:alpha-glucosidase
LSLYRQLIRLRHQRTALSVGRYSHVHCEGNVMSYERSDGSGRLEILLNFGHRPESVSLQGSGMVLLSTHLDRAGETVTGACSLRPDEGLIVELR